MNITFMFTVFSPNTNPSIQDTPFHLTGTRQCNCSMLPCEDSAPSESDGGGEDSQNFIFYAVIGGVGGLIFLVVVVAVVYQCILLGMWFRRNHLNRDEEE